MHCVSLQHEAQQMELFEALGLTECSEITVRPNQITYMEDKMFQAQHKSICIRILNHIHPSLHSIDFQREFNSYCLDVDF